MHDTAGVRMDTGYGWVSGCKIRLSKNGHRIWLGGNGCRIQLGEWMQDVAG